MKPHLTHSLFLVLVLLFAATCRSHAQAAAAAPDWEKDRLLRAVYKTAYGLMGEYEAWSDDWARSDKTITEKDKIINRMGEHCFINVIQALSVSPNAKFVTECARFLDTHVPPEFDGTWRFVFIEIGNVGRGADGRLLSDAHLENLAKRAMKPEPK